VNAVDACADGQECGHDEYEAGCPECEASEELQLSEPSVLTKVQRA
jgi:hypothetical protein